MTEDSTRHDEVADLSTVQLVERMTQQVGTLVRTEINTGLALAHESPK